MELFLLKNKDHFIYIIYNTSGIMIIYIIWAGGMIPSLDENGASLLSNRVTFWLITIDGQGVWRGWCWPGCGRGRSSGIARFWVRPCPLRNLPDRGPVLPERPRKGCGSSSVAYRTCKTRFCTTRSASSATPFSTSSGVNCSGFPQRHPPSTADPRPGNPGSPRLIRTR